jgi:hypothetical protein
MFLQQINRSQKFEIHFFPIWTINKKCDSSKNCFKAAKNFLFFEKLQLIEILGHAQIHAKRHFVICTKFGNIHFL